MSYRGVLLWECVNVHIYICIYPHAYVRISIYIYACMYPHAHVRVYIYIHIYIYADWAIQGFHITGSCLGISILGMVAFGRFQRKPSRLEIPVWGLGLRM